MNVEPEKLLVPPHAPPDGAEPPPSLREALALAGREVGGYRAMVQRLNGTASPLALQIGSVLERVEAALVAHAETPTTPESRYENAWRSLRRALEKAFDEGGKETEYLRGRVAQLGATLGVMRELEQEQGIRT